MALAANPAMYVDQWMKPFGSDSDRREWLAVTPLQVQNVAQFRTTFGGTVEKFHALAQSHFWKPLDIERVKPRIRQSVVKLKYYAHDRVVLSTFVQAPDIRKGLSGWTKWKAAIAAPQFFNLRRDIQSCWNILGRPRFKPARTSFTTYARNMTRDCAHMLELSVGGRCVFGTVTLPGSEENGWEAVGAATGDIANLMNTWLRNKVVDGEYVYVWEMQGRGAPHMHYMFRLPESTKLEDFSSDFQREWRKILLAVGDSCGIDLFRRDEYCTWRGDDQYPHCDLRPVTYTFEKYISKYISKNRSKNGEEHVVYPRRWWGCSNGLRNRVRENRFEDIVPVDDTEIGFDALQSVVSRLGSTAAGIKFFPRMKGCPIDSVSIQLPPKEGREISKALVLYLQDGDLSALECALLAAHERVYDVPLKEVPG